MQTCIGLGAERRETLALVHAHRSSGAVLDTLTLWAAVGLGAIDVLKAVFARVAVARSTLDDLALLRSNHRMDPACEGGTMSYSGGRLQFDEHTPEMLALRAKAIADREKAVIDEFEVLPVDAPDDLHTNAELMVHAFGPHVLDSAIVARRHGMILISEDHPYRRATHEALQVEGAWLQVVFMYARDAGLITPERYASLIVGLAQLGHRHLTLDGPTLNEVHRLESEGNFDAVAEYIGTEKAEIRSHVEVTSDFLRSLWSTAIVDLRSMAATGTMLENLVRHRRKDWANILALLARAMSGNALFHAYLRSWVLGHFLPWEPVAAALSRR